jgi:histidinol-phosphate/aromatic aminotransferase/cobyric acid decarboxylase-like protein
MTTPLPPAGAHGGDGPAVARWLGVDPIEILDLSASLNPFPSDIAPLLHRHAGATRRYGDPSALEVRLAALIDVDPRRVVLTNGASEAIALVAQVVPRGRVDEPEFSLYRRHLDIDETAGLWRSNPHSPSGRLAAADDTAAVWDEAYWQLATGTWTRGDHRRGSIVIGSLTKLMATPGLRVGWIVAPADEIADDLRGRRPEWSVGELALEVSSDLLDAIDLTSSSEQIAEARRALVTALEARSLAVEAADAPWVLVHLVPRLRDDLARHGVVIRDCTSFGMPETVRIAVPDSSGLDRLLDALDRTTPTFDTSTPKDP